MIEENEKLTDWEAYYSKRKSIFSSLTQKFTLKKILYCIEKYGGNSGDIMELGGGNSCFAKQLMKLCKRSINTYSIIDNCSLAVSKFKQMEIPGNAYLLDLTLDNITGNIIECYDIVYSIGLVEHFQGKDLEQIIKNHFLLCKEGGMVLISVPTPTIQYCFTRKLMEKLRVWDFPDEKPLRYDEVEQFISGGVYC